MVGMKRIGEEWVRELKKGSIQLCILAVLSSGKKYGFQIIKELRELSMGYYDLKEGTLYPALHRLEKRGYLKSEWITQERGMPRKYYALTKKGKEALGEAKKEWTKMVSSCNQVLEAGK
ncbi:MAG: PadR family transcriptional regulator [Methanomassiliicoccales archaeon]|nr:MAG: PadR family transcriptional regulator [Methanomassiliicoccales archaeon]